MEYYRIAQVVRPHGVRGGLKLSLLTDDPGRFRGMKEAYLEQDGARRPVSLRDVSVQPDAVYLSIPGVDTREAAEALRGAYLVVDKAHAVKLPPFTWFVADLIGCTVSDTAGEVYGEITDVLETGANDVYVVRGPKNALVPALKRVLHEVNTEEKRVVLVKEVAEEVVVFED